MNWLSPLTIYNSTGSLLHAKPFDHIKLTTQKKKERKKTDTSYHLMWQGSNDTENYYKHKMS